MTAIVTEGYAPFEQYMENGNQGTWTDIYALAGVLYFAITRTKPPSAVERAKAGDHDPCICLSDTYASGYSAAFLQSIDAGLRVDERLRLQSAHEWEGILSGSAPLPASEPQSTPASPPVPPGQMASSGQAIAGALPDLPGHPVSTAAPPPSRGQTITTLMMAALLVLGAVGFFCFWKSARNATRRPRWRN